MSLIVNISDFSLEFQKKVDLYYRYKLKFTANISQFHYPYIVRFNLIDAENSTNLADLEMLEYPENI